MSLLSRIKRVLFAEANTVVDTMEDATKVSTQALREMNESLSTAINAEAGVKATALRAASDLVKAKQAVTTWENQTMAILKKIKDGDSSDETVRLSKVAAEKYNDALKQVAEKEVLAKMTNSQVEKMDANIQNLRKRIDEAGNQVSNISARQKVAEASLTINKTLSTTNVDGLTSTINRMKEKVDGVEFEAEAFAGSDSVTSDSAKIEKLLDSNSVEDTLAKFNERLNSK